MGKKISKLEPIPGLLATETAPSCVLTIPCTTESPKPVPSPAGFVVSAATVPDAQVDLVGLYVERAIPSGAYALITGEKPEDYWYVMPVVLAVAAIALLFAWALVRAIRRDLLPARA